VRRSSARVFFLSCARKAHKKQLLREASPISAIQSRFQIILFLSVSRSLLEPALLVASSPICEFEFKMAAAEGKFVWLETLRKARKTSLVQDGK